MELRTLIQLLFLAQAVKYLAIPPWSISFLNPSQATYAFEITDWSWLPAGSLPTGDFCLSAWVKSNYLSAGAFNLQIEALSRSLTFAWRNSDAVTAIDSTAVVTQTLALDANWYFVAISLENGNINTVIGRRDGTTAFNQGGVTGGITFQLAEGAVVRSPSPVQTMSGYVTEATLRVNEGLTANDLLALVQNSFLCGQSSGGVCKTCHPSCATCIGELCSTCTDSVNTVKSLSNTVCLCSDTTKGSVGSYHESCASCDSTCGKCWISDDANQCRTCGAEVGEGTGIGSCTCPDGSAKDTLAQVCAVPVVQCHSNCQFCYGPGEYECLTQAQKDFIDKVQSIGSLPLSSTRTDQLLCFRQQPATATCDTNALEEVIDTITGDVPDTAQCQKLLVVEWPFLTYWFGELFQGYSDPTPATADQILTIKSVMYVWILHFGPSEMLAEDWATLKTDLSGGGDWSNYLAWAGETPKYTKDGTNTSFDFPEALSAWIKDSEGCAKVPAGCMDLLVFNTLSTSCDASNCGHSTECDLAFTSHSCLP